MSSSQIALRVEAVSKQYRVYAHPGDRLKETLTRGRLRCHREFWALRDIDFEIEAGTTTGIIGPNGSGKSTLLQIITGTLEPTAGQVAHAGRIAALLELGAGFNPEFTGLENVYMNAALMGFTRRDTERLLPEIERFAEIGAFIHQPVKTYSSGMYVRLAFASAISCEPDILIVDEALSVGDAVFQHRCLRRIKQMQETGTTILFVSHDPSAIKALCSRCVLLNSGRVEADGRPSDVLNRYQKLIMDREEAYESQEPPPSDGRGEVTLGANHLTSDEASSMVNKLRAALPHSYRHGDKSAEVISADILDASGENAELVESGAPLEARLRVVFHRDLNDPVIGFLICNRLGLHAYGVNTEQRRVRFGKVLQGEIIEVKFAFECWLGTGLYNVAFAVHSEDGISYDWLDGIRFFQVMSATPIEGMANLNATASVRRIGRTSEASTHETKSEVIAHVD